MPQSVTYVIAVQTDTQNHLPHNIISKNDLLTTKSNIGRSKEL
jgi:hypothetical protein